VHRIVTQKFGGKIDVKSEPGNTRFEVRLPLTGNGTGAAKLPDSSQFPALSIPQKL
jgi:nitrogen-specific signal transduction histidine kinase